MRGIPNGTAVFDPVSISIRGLKTEEDVKAIVADLESRFGTLSATAQIVPYLDEIGVKWEYVEP